MNVRRIAQEGTNVNKLEQEDIGLIPGLPGQCQAPSITPTRVTIVLSGRSGDRL